MNGSRGIASSDESQGFPLLLALGPVLIGSEHETPQVFCRSAAQFVARYVVSKWRTAKLAPDVVLVDRTALADLIVAELILPEIFETLFPDLLEGHLVEISSFIGFIAHAIATWEDATVARDVGNTSPAFLLISGALKSLTKFDCLH